jgi:hypothetical protein
MNNKMKPRRSILLLACMVALALSATAAATANASPVWKFNGTELTGKETIVGAAISSSLTIPGATTICSHFLYNMKISNVSGKGTGEITELPLFECYTTNKVCTVENIEAEKIPWPTHLTTVSGKDYLIVEGIRVEITYGGELCALDKTTEIVKGTAGGEIQNSTQKAVFDAATFTATGTQLKAGATVVEWNGEFPTEAFETHREQTLEG